MEVRINKLFKIKDQSSKNILDLACELKLLYKFKQEAVEFHCRSKLNIPCTACKACGVVHSREKKMA